jgi:hypothetical protein
MQVIFFNIVVFLQLFLLERKFGDANPLLHQMGPMIENWVQANTHQKESVAKQQKEYLQMFFLVLQVQDAANICKITEPPIITIFFRSAIT